MNKYLTYKSAWMGSTSSISLYPGRKLSPVQPPRSTNVWVVSPYCGGSRGVSNYLKHFAIINSFWIENRRRASNGERIFDSSRTAKSCNESKIKDQRGRYRLDTSEGESSVIIRLSPGFPYTLRSIFQGSFVETTAVFNREGNVFHGITVFNKMWSVFWNKKPTQQLVDN